MNKGNNFLKWILRIDYLVIFGIAILLLSQGTILLLDLENNKTSGIEIFAGISCIVIGIGVLFVAFSMKKKREEIIEDEDL